VYFFFRHGYRPTRDVADDVGLDPLDDLGSRNLAHARTGYAARMDFHFDSPRSCPRHVAFRLTIGKQAVVIKNELDQSASRLRDGVEILFLKTGNEQQRSGIDFHSGRTQVVVATLRQESERKGCSRIGRQRKARHVELSCGDERRDSSMHIVIDPGRGVLRWSEFTKRRVRMRIDETRNGRYASGVDDNRGTAADRRSNFLDDSILD